MTRFRSKLERQNATIMTRNVKNQRGRMNLQLYQLPPLGTTRNHQCANFMMEHTFGKIAQTTSGTRTGKNR